MIDTITQTEVIPSAGLEIQGIMRGLLGIVVLLTIAVACSSNRKKIPKTVGIGLLIQLTLAIGILRVGWVQKIFEGIENSLSVS